MYSTLRSRIFRSRWMAVGWFILITSLFFIPGTALPEENWLTDLQFDKWVHIGFFAILLFLWRSAFDREERTYNFILLFIAFVYGLLVEI